MSSTEGRVAAIAVRTEKLGPMREIEVANAALGGGIDGDIPVKITRGITLISREQWEQAMGELGADLPWHTRRANVLVEGLPLQNLVGRVVRVGGVQIHIHGETEPCGLMDRLYDGLQFALKPEMRGGVHGEVIQAGAFSVGDTITLLP
ncbi:MAG TPA: MOSC domain-containing protein [Candidatus Hydrogenedentes bacterium]|nr:MOSC domain-containing protein [Candidatus Hydrogenedentota bacterium]